MAGLTQLFPEFVTHLALLIVLCYINGLMFRKLRRQPEERLPAINGILFGLTAIAGMTMPMTLADGDILDARNIVVMLAAPYGGFAAGVIAGLMAAGFRIWQGGIGVVAGTGAIVTAALIGIAFRAYISRPPARIKILELLGLSLIVTVASLAWTFTLPNSVDPVALIATYLAPLLLVHPVATIFLGAILTDVHRRLELIERLRRNEARLIASQHLARLGDFTWDVRSGDVFWSDGMYELVGHGRDQVIDFDFVSTKLHHPDDLDRINEWLESGMRERKSDLGRNTYRIIRGDGTVIHILVSIRCEFRGDEIRRLHGTCLDVTELVQSLESLERAKEEAERANRAKSSFLASMSHELRTPLNAIIGFSDILRLQSLGPDQTAKYREYAGDINSSALHLLGLVENILDLSAIEAGRRNVEIVPLDLHQIVADALKLVEGKAWTRSIRLVTDLDPDCRDIRSDRSSLLQILLNLLGNSLKFTPIGGSVTVRTRRIDDGFQLQVSDTGIGIDPGALPHLTSYFSRALDNPYLAEKGWGLGLGITRSLVDLLGGRITIDSQPGKGTTVTITLPQGEREGTS